MLHFFRKYFAFFTGGLVFFLSAGTDIKAADGTLYLLNYEDVETSPRARVIQLTEKLKRLSRQTVPSVKTGRTREIFAVLSDGRKSRPFTFRTDKLGNLRIILPDSYPKLLSEPDVLPRLTAWYLFGRAGKNPELEKYVRNSWFAVGLARKLFEEMNSSRTPFSGYFPAAYTLTSTNRYPTLQSLLETPLKPEDTVLRMIYEEYCELLVLICARNGLFKGGLLANLLDELEKSPERDDMPDLFRNLAYPILKKRSPKIFPPDLMEPRLRDAYEIWFRRELDEMLNWNFLPAPAEKIETRYLQTVHFSSPLKKTDQNNQKTETVQGGLKTLIQYYRQLENPEKTAHSILDGLVRLIYSASPDLKVPISRIRSAVQNFTAAPSAQTGELLLSEEQNFFRSVEKNLLLTQFLSETERECVAPATRYYLTFSLIDYEKRMQVQPVPRLTRLLEQVTKEAEK